jgi:hypothetical protein
MAACGSNVQSNQAFHERQAEPQSAGRADRDGLDGSDTRWRKHKRTDSDNVRTREWQVRA